MPAVQDCRDNVGGEEGEPDETRNVRPDDPLLCGDLDEAHNLKHGFSRSASARNRVLGLALGRDPKADNIRLPVGQLG